MIITILFIFIILQGHFYNKLKEAAKLKGILKHKNSVLLITAHPDDETMFFTPTIRLMTELSMQVTLLCLSHGIGLNRQEELKEACKALGIEECICLDEPELQDGFDQDWSPEVVSEAVGRTLQKYEFDFVLTFDNYGVSGHPNHKAVHLGARLALASRASDIGLLELESVWLCKKYLGVFSCFFDFLYFERGDTLHVATSPYDAYWKTQRAMEKHASQLVWFRRLYLVFSRYIYINSLKMVSK